MKSTITHWAWVNSEDTAFSAMDCGGVLVQSGLALPKDSTEFAARCEKKNAGLSFAAEASIQVDSDENDEILCGIVMNRLSPSAARETGLGAVWGINSKSLDEMIEILLSVRDKYKASHTDD